MQGYDLFMIIILAAAVIWGAWKGLAWQVASLASVVLSYVAAMMFRQPVANFLSQQVELVPPLDTGLAMLILFPRHVARRLGRIQPGFRVDSEAQAQGV